MTFQTAASKLIDKWHLFEPEEAIAKGNFLKALTDLVEADKKRTYSNGFAKGKLAGAEWVLEHKDDPIPPNLGTVKLKETI